LSEVVAVLGAVVAPLVVTWNRGVDESPPHPVRTMAATPSRSLNRIYPPVSGPPPAPCRAEVPY